MIFLSRKHRQGFLDEMNFIFSNSLIFHGVMETQVLESTDFLEKKFTFYFFPQKIIILEKIVVGNSISFWKNYLPVFMFLFSDFEIGLVTSSLGQYFYVFPSVWPVLAAGTSIFEITVHDLYTLIS